MHTRSHNNASGQCRDSVWVKKHRNTTILEALLNTLQEEDPIEWTKLKIRECIATRGEFNLGRITYLLKNNFASISTSTSTSTSISTIKNLILPTSTTTIKTTATSPRLIPTP